MSQPATDWTKVDWSKTNMQLALKYGVSYACVGSWRKRVGVKREKLKGEK